MTNWKRLAIHAGKTMSAVALCAFVLATPVLAEESKGGTAQQTAAIARFAKTQDFEGSWLNQRKRLNHRFLLSILERGRQETLAKANLSETQKNTLVKTLQDDLPGLEAELLKGEAQRDSSGNIVAELIENIYLSHFSVDELNEISATLEDPIGKKFLATRSKLNEDMKTMDEAAAFKKYFSADEKAHLEKMMQIPAAQKLKKLNPQMADEMGQFFLKKYDVELLAAANQLIDRMREMIQEQRTN